MRAHEAVTVFCIESKGYECGLRSCCRLFFNANFRHFDF